MAQQLQALSLYPGDLNGQVEPPPPYPMGSAALPSSAPPPSYSATLAMRQSPTLSSTSSDYRWANVKRTVGRDFLSQFCLSETLLPRMYELHNYLPNFVQFKTNAIYALGFTAQSRRNWAM